MQQLMRPSQLANPLQPSHRGLACLCRHSTIIQE
jgi:hypothetical protein